MTSTGRPDPAELDAVTPAYYVQVDDDLYRPTLRTQGAWQDWEQHMAPVAGLATHVIEQHEHRSDLQIARLTFEILGVIPAAPTRVTVRTLRPGKTIELVEAVVSVGGRDVVRASAWRLSRQDTSAVAGHPDSTLPSPDQLDDEAGFHLWGGGFIDSLVMRAAADHAPGHGRAWLRSDTPLIHEVEAGPVAEWMKLVDTANGVAPREEPGLWIFPNVDLTVHLYREPQPGWVGFETAVSFGPSGVGLTATTLHDLGGPVGRAEQILTVRRMPGSNCRAAVRPSHRR